MTPTIRVLNPTRVPAAADEEDFGRALAAGLAMQPRRVSPKFFYDEAGARLFDRICELPEYYPTRTELALLETHAEEMAEAIGPRADVIEFGAGSMTKIRTLLRALREPVRYLAVDISTDHLHRHADLLQQEFPELEITPLAGDFTRRLALPPAARAPHARVGFFPGSSIGNFAPDEARQFLQAAARTLRGGGLLIGVDQVKAPEILHAAYNDAAGVTAAFNKNLLARANRELGADFDLDAFDHYAFFNPHESRVEMHLISNRVQQVRFGRQRFSFVPGQTLHTENSYKYTPGGFRALARSAGFEPRRTWSDARGWFSVHWLALP